MMPVLFGLHVLAAVIWVGGMFFAYMAARPAAAQVLDAPARLTFWSRTFAKFFVWVWAIVIVLPVTGYGMAFAFFGGLGHLGVHIHIMQGLGILMILIFLHLYFAPYQRLSHAVTLGDFETAGRELARIRRIIATNLSLGLIVIVVAASGRYLPLN